jgi:hypothetical protein
MMPILIYLRAFLPPLFLIVAILFCGLGSCLLALLLWRELREWLGERQWLTAQRKNSFRAIRRMPPVLPCKK